MNTKIYNYRNKHIVVAIGCIYLIASGIIFKGVNSVVEILLGLIVIVMQAKLGSGSRYEKEDEMVKENLSKANKAALIAFFIMAAAIPMVYVFADLPPVDIREIYTNPYHYTALAVLGIRSIAYIILDRPVRAEEDK